MDLISYQRLVLTHTLNVMACDGDIDAREVEEFRRMATATPYFDELDVEQELAAALKHLSEHGRGGIEKALEDLAGAAISERQRLRLLDVLLHVVHADETVEEAERAYLQSAREALGIAVEELAQHFPARFAIFVPGSGAKFQMAAVFKLPETLPDTSRFLNANDVAP